MQIDLSNGITTYETEKHEYLEFDHKPADPKIVEAIQKRCFRLASLDGKDLKVKMTVTVDGKKYTSDNEAELNIGISSLTDAESFSIDSYINGFVTVKDLGSEKSSDPFYVGIETDPSFELFVAQIYNVENFIYKLAEFYCSSGEFYCKKIENGEYVDLSSQFSADIVNSEIKNWYSYSLGLGIECKEKYSDILERIKETVLKRVPESELPYIQESWDDSKEENSSYIAVLNDTQWTDDIKSLEDFLCEINGIVAEYDGANYIDTDISGYKLCNILMDSDNFGVADIVVTDNEAHVMGLYF